MKTKNLLLTLFLSTIIMIEFLFLVILKNNFSSSLEVVKMLEIQVLLLYLLGIFQTKIVFRRRWIDLSMFFYFTLGIFLLFRIFMNIFGFFDIQVGTYLFTDIHFSNNATVELLIYISLFLTFLQLGFLLFSFHSNNEQNIIVLKRDNAMRKFGLMLFFLGLPGALVVAIIRLQYTLSHGYLSLFSSLETVHLPLWTMGSDTITTIGYMFFVASIPTKKKFILISVVFLFLIGISTIMGSRGRFMLTLLYIIWYYYHFIFLEKPKKQLVLLIIPIIFGLVAIASIRNNVGIDFKDVFLTFFIDQGTSLLIIQGLIAYQNEFINTGLPYILEPLSFKEYIFGLHFPSLSNQLGTFVNMDRVSNGATLGSSFLGELYDLGFTGFILNSLLLGGFINYFSKKVLHSRIALLFSYLILYTLWWMPRSHFLPSLKMLIYLLVFWVIFKLITRKKPLEINLVSKA